MNSLPLVSIICLCHNQKNFVRSAIHSALSQTYPNLELILVDDASTDGSVQVIEEVIKEHGDIRFIQLTENIGNCRAFNRGLSKSKGKYIIDLAADDELLPVRVELGVADFESKDPKYGVHFSDAFIVDHKGKPLKTHYDRDVDGRIREEIPQGNVYLDLIKRYFINPPSMMTRREVLEQMGGYDEELAYEDFDFWIRSSRDYEYLFNKTPLVRKRILKHSLSAHQSKLQNKHQKTTLMVCQKILTLNRNKEEDQALISRCWYEIRQCIKTFNLGLIFSYVAIIREAGRMERSRSSSTQQFGS